MQQERLGLRPACTTEEARSRTFMGEERSAPQLVCTTEELSALLRAFMQQERSALRLACTTEQLSAQ